MHQSKKKYEVILSKPKNIVFETLKKNQKSCQKMFLYQLWTKKPIGFFPFLPLEFRV